MTTVTLDEATRADAYWREAHARANGHRSEGLSLDYEDYAPAYCVGYAGFAQYGGSFHDSESSLCANWVRIKGDSRLSYEQALPAIRAAWDRAAQAESPVMERGEIALA